MALIRGVAVAIIAVMVTTYVSAQMVATGKALSGFVGLDYRAGVIIGAAIGLPSLGVPQMLTRYMSARDDMELRKARVVSIAVLTVAVSRLGDRQGKG